jgi:chromosome segregation ATPase
MSFFTRRAPVEDPRDTRIRELEDENKALTLLVTDAAELRKKHTQEVERWQRQISDLNAELDTKDAFNRALNRAFDQKQAELDKTLAAFKQLDADYVEACGRLQDAEERLAGYQRVTT